MTRTHRALRLHGPQDLRLETVPYPNDPRAGEVRLRVTAAGICGSDLHTYLDGRIGDIHVESPLVLGHEFAGVIESVGPIPNDGTANQLQVGERVAVDPAHSCGHCELCRLGHPNLCTNLTFAGLYPRDGAFQEMLTVPAESCFPMPDEIDDTQAATLEPLGIAMHAVDLAHIKPGQTAAIVGAGPIGLCVLQIALLSGVAVVFSTDQHPWRLDTAAKLGARTINVDDTDPVATIMKATKGRGVDVALECAWSSEDALSQAVDVLRPGGRLVIVGIAGDDRLTFKHSAVRRRGLTIAMCRRMRHTYPRAIELVQQGMVHLGELVTDHVGLEEAATAFADAAGYRPGIIKVMVHPTTTGTE